MESEYRDNEQDYAEMNHELELMTLAALTRCAGAGGDPDDLQFLAAQLGVGDQFKRADTHA
jgi:hypothetical protein